MRVVNDEEVDTETKALKANGLCKSNDPHVLALAQVSGARLLYSNDKDLQQDFKNKALINSPRGKVYSTLENKDFTLSHRRLLGRNNLCQA